MRKLSAEEREQLLGGIQEYEKRKIPQNQMQRLRATEPYYPVIPVDGQYILLAVSKSSRLELIWLCSWFQVDSAYRDRNNVYRVELNINGRLVNDMLCPKDVIRACFASFRTHLVCIFSLHLSKNLRHNLHTPRYETGSYESGIFFVELPSKRRLAYVRSRVEKDDNGRKSITYEGIGSTHKWKRLKTMQDMEIVGHMHDEVIVECDLDVLVEQVCSRMEQTPEWADGYECAFYMKQ